VEINLNETEIEFLGSEGFKVTTSELKMIMGKHGVRNQLLFAVLLQYYKIKHQFPDTHNGLVSYLSKIMADKIKTETCYFHEIDTNHRTVKRFKHAIRKMFGFREPTDADSIQFIDWLVSVYLPKMPKDHEVAVAIRAWYQSAKIEPFSDKQQARYLDSARNKFEEQLFKKIVNRLSKKDKEFIDSILNRAMDDLDEKQCSKEINLNTLKKGIPGAKLKHVQFAVEKYEAIRTLWLPDSITASLSRKILLKYYDRIMAYSPSHINELDECAKYAMVTIFCHIRAELLADSLGDLFVKLVRKIEKSSENYVNKKVVKEIKRVEGKLDILSKLVETSLDNPDGVIKETIYPVVDVETLKRLKEDLSHRGHWYKKQVRAKMRSLYSHGSRTELLDLLSLLKFNARDDEGKALLSAVNFIIKHRNTLGDVYKADDQAPLIHVIPNDWLDFIIEHQIISVSASDMVRIFFQLQEEQHDYFTMLPICDQLLSSYLCILKSNHSTAVNKLNYEMVVCNEVRKKLNYKGIWIDEGYRYRDPKKDTPADFEENKAKYYKELGLPMDVMKFIASLKNEVTNSLSSLNGTILNNDKVALSDKKGGQITISPSLPQKIPENIIDLHNEIIKRWGYINLIDAFKEANIRIGFTDFLETVGKYSNLDAEHLVMRLLLSLYAIGSNTGLKRISIANPDASESELHYVKRRFINPTNVRLAIREVINAVIGIRDPKIFGTATTTVACDSKKLNAWDQNLINEWHGRYKGHGIMVYWHVDTNALCIYSQSKTCTSSEVGAMIKGVLEHSTEMDLNSAYVDTHGQSTIGFGTCWLLHFKILPRLKNIHKQKLYMVSDSDKDVYTNLTAILKDSIQWKHIEEHYDEAVKHLAALKTGLVEADVFIKRFSNDNYKHPAYKALCEIGKAAKTIFLCDYLQHEELRIEINEGLNIVERLNSVMNFFFYGKLGEVNSNDPEEQELSILCLHLLQACAVYINTLLIQEILSDPAWRNRLTPEDYRALSPLIHSHFNPYGTFLLDLAKRLMIGIEDFTHENTSQRESEAINQIA